MVLVNRIVNNKDKLLLPVPGIFAQSVMVQVAEQTLGFVAQNLAKFVPVAAGSVVQLFYSADN